MSNQLPRLPNNDRIRSVHVEAFGGLNHSIGAASGEIWDMQNLTSDYAPRLASRAKRHLARTLTAPNGLFSDGRLIYADGTKLYADGVLIGTVEDSEKTMCGINGRVVIFPDKVIITKEGSLEPLEASYSAGGLRFHDGEYAEEAAEANSITTAGAAFPFKVGDAVTITGCTEEPRNNRTPIIREISADGKTLRFYENTFTLPEGSTSITETGIVTLKRTVPDLDYICVNENRVWGCKGDSIFCSKLGDPYNWNVFDGLSTDAWSVDSGTAGNFTACVSFLGYPVFFKEDKIFKVYGSKPGNFQLMSSATMGVLDGAAKSLAIAGEVLFYLSRAGMMSYNGAIPQAANNAFGDTQFTSCVSGSDGVKLFSSLTDTEGTTALYVYDTRRGVWHKEDSTALIFTAYCGCLYGLTSDGKLETLGVPVTVPAGSTKEADFESFFETSDYTLESFDGKYPVRLRLRFECDESCTVAVAISYDGGEWETAATVQTTRKRSVYLPVPIRRCDYFRIKMAANAGWKLYAMEWEIYDENYVRK